MNKILIKNFKDLQKEFIESWLFSFLKDKKL